MINYRKGSFIKVGDKFGKVIEESFGVIEVQFSEDDVQLITADKIDPLDSSFQGVATPTKDDLTKIALFQPLNSKLLSPDDVVVITLIAADNMLDRSLARWNPIDLEKLAKLPVGFPCILNHDSYEVAKTQGVVFDSGIVRYSTVPSYFTNTANNGVYNRAIAKDEGYVGFVLRVALEADSELVEQLNLGVGWVSLGYAYQDIYCPLCQTSFYDDKCPHGVPMSWKDQADKRYAPWREKKDP